MAHAARAYTEYLLDFRRAYSVESRVVRGSVKYVPDHAGARHDGLRDSTRTGAVQWIGQPDTRDVHDRTPERLAQRPGFTPAVSPRARECAGACAHAIQNGAKSLMIGPRWPITIIGGELSNEPFRNRYRVR